MTEPSFTARIEELTTQNARLTTELEQWKMISSQADMAKCQLEAELEADQSTIVALREENIHIRQILKFARTSAMNLIESINDICVESVDSASDICE